MSKEGFSGGPAVKSLPAMQEMRIWSLGQEDSLEKEMATLSGILLGSRMDRGAWRAPVHEVTKKPDTI